MMNLSSATARRPTAVTSSAAQRTAPRINLLLILIIEISWSEHKAAGHKGACGLALRLVEEFFCRAMLDNAPVVQEDDVLREPARLADVVRHNNDLDAAALRFDQ